MNIRFPFSSATLYRTFSHPTEEKIFDFSTLEKGWNYGEGEEFSIEAIKSALDLHREIIFRGYSRTDAFPGLDGEIQITIYEDDHYFAFEREASGEWSVMHETNGEVNTVSGLNFEKVIKYLTSINSKLCNVSDYYRGETIGTRHVEDSMTWRSNHDMMEYPSLTECAV
jgi:hypothetical protein